MQFSEILGNIKLKKQLINSVQHNRIAHAQMFFGEKSSPKLLLALSYAKYINCQNKSLDDSCGYCPSCTKYQNLTHPDLHLVFPVLLIKNNKRPTSDDFVADWRSEVLKNPFIDLSVWFDTFSNENKTGKTGYIYTQEIESLNKKLLLKHYESEFRVVLIWLPENMQANTSNKLLKLLEEPPQKTIFLLVSENTNLILKTIISRVQIIKIPKYNSIEIEGFLKEKFSSRNGEEVKKIISLTGGNLSLSVQMLHNESFENKNFEEYQNWMRLCYSSNILETTKWVNNRAAKGRRSHSIFLLYSLKMIRNCLVFQFFDKNKLFITKDEKLFLTKFHPFVHENNIMQITHLLEESVKNIERNANPKIIFYELSLQFMKLLKVNRKFVETN